MSRGKPARRDWGLWTIVLLFLVVTPILLTPWIHGNDGLGYYMILRSTVIDHDLDFSNEIAAFQPKFPDLHYPISAITGLPVTHYGIGNALLWSPWFAVAHLFVKMENAFGGSTPQDGFSYPYIFLVSLSSAVYAGIGLILLYKLASDLVTKGAALGATLLVWFATPLLYYMYFSPTVSHANSFFAITVFLFAWYKTRKSRSPWQWVLLGVLGALVFLVRMEDALILILPAIDSLWRHKQAIARKMIDVKELLGDAIFLGSFALAAFPQFVFFKTIYGTWWVTGEQLKKHSFDPSLLLQVHKILLAPDHGLFLWAPVTLVGLIGLYWLIKEDGLAGVSVSVALLLVILFNATIKQWMAIASFSARHFVGVLALFGLGIAMCWQRAEDRFGLPWVVCAAVLFILYNLNLVIQYGAGILAIQDPLLLGDFLHNTLQVLPRRLFDIITKFLFKRGSFITP